MRRCPMFARFAIGTAVAITLLASTAMANGPLQVTSSIMAEQKRAAADGTTRVTLVPARKVVPGDRVVFSLAYRNTGTQALGNVVIDNPVPKGIVYRAPAAGSPAPEVSVDGKSYGALAALRVKASGGALRSAEPDDVSHVRWTLATLPAGAQGKLSFQAVLK
jgi:uncharacterized repeat protein (TIGR01451 family)